MSMSWQCSHCTFQHKFPAPKCQMCGMPSEPISTEKSPSKQISQQLIHGISSSIASTNENNASFNKASITNSSCSQSYPLQNITSNDTTQHLQTTKNSSSGKSPIVNPYASQKAKATNKENGNFVTVQSSTHQNIPKPTGTSTIIQSKIQTPKSNLSSNHYNYERTVLASKPSSFLDAPSLQNIDTPLNDIPSNEKRINIMISSRNVEPSYIRHKHPNQHENSNETLQQRHPPLPQNIQNQSNPIDKSKLKSIQTHTMIPICPSTSTTWVYPIHPLYPIRQYQLNITQKALFHNTLVSLPTGLGKTLIAAVVMYNYYRWFGSNDDNNRMNANVNANANHPRAGIGKIVFCAPTRPLVNQQMEACYNIVNIPNDHIAEISGKILPSIRKKLWNGSTNCGTTKAKASVFFCTPQTLMQDILKGICPARDIVCVVFDEAHKAKGDYAYVKVIQLLEQCGAIYRVLGLSATPGTNIPNIQQVITNLNIEEIQVKLETDHDVKPYIHEKEWETVIVKQSSEVNELEKVMNHIIQPIMERLCAHNGFQGSSIGNNHKTLTPYMVLKAKTNYQELTNDHTLGGHFYALQTLIDWRNNLKTSGIGVIKGKMLRYLSVDPENHTFKNHATGYLGTVLKSSAFKNLWELVQEATTNSQSQSLPYTQNTKKRHRKKNNPKLQALSDILIEHFERAKACNESSRAIVFSQWRDSVEEIVDVLDMEQPLLKPRKFVGQGGSNVSSKRGRKKSKESDLSLHNSSGPSASNKNVGMNQKEQQKVLENFKAGVYNVIVCTCIGEEGLDIGEVDLIVNFDCLQSPIRMIQRNGRTGRKRKGRVICLVAEGQEEKRLKASTSATKSLGRALKNVSSFRLKKNKPLFPTLPVLEMKEMQQMEKYRLSQVGGHTPKKDRRKNSKHESSDEEDIFVCSTSWKLTPEQEMNRQRLFGPFVVNRKLSILNERSSSFPQSLRRTLTKIYTRETILRLQKHQKMNKFVRTGRINRILRKLEDQALSSGILNKCVLLHTPRNKKKQKMNETRDATVKQNLDSNNCEISLNNASFSSYNRADNCKKGNTDDFKNKLCFDKTIDILKIDRISASNRMGSERAKTIHLRAVSNSRELLSRPADSETFNFDSKDKKLQITTHDLESDNRSNGSNLALEHEIKLHFESKIESETSKENAKFNPLPEMGKTLNKEVISASKVQIRKRNTAYCSEQDVLHFTSTDQSNVIQVACESKNSEAAINNEKAGHKISPPAPDFANEDALNTGFYLSTPSDSSSSSSNDERDESDDDEGSYGKNTNRASEMDCHDVQDELQQSHVEEKEDHHNMVCLSINTCTKENSVDENESKVQLGETRLLENSKEENKFTSKLKDGLDNINDSFKVNCKFALNFSQESSSASSSSSDSSEESVNSNVLDGKNMNNQYPPGVSREHSSLNANDPMSSMSYSVVSNEEKEKSTPILFKPSENNKESPLFLNRKNNQNRKNRCLLSHDDVESPIGKTHSKEVESTDELIDTPTSRKGIKSTPQSDQHFPEVFSMNVENSSNEIICAICKRSESSKEDPIVFCDGPNNDYSCNFTVHKSCYKISGNIEQMEHWRCDVCEMKHNSTSVKAREKVLEHPSRQICTQAIRALKKNPSTGSFQAHNVKDSSPLCETELAEDSIHSEENVVITSKRKRLTKIKDKLDQASNKTRDSMDEQTRKAQKKERIEARLKKRQGEIAFHKFLDTEAGIETDEDIDGDADEDSGIERIEGEERLSNDSFINDTSQLGHSSQDSLDHAESNIQSDFAHRELDTIDAHKNMLATPILNRRMKNGANIEWESPSPRPGSSGMKGLGNMHFIRSVIDHHKQGGDATELEAEYYMLAEYGTQYVEDEEFFHKVSEEKKDTENNYCIEEFSSPNVLESNAAKSAVSDKYTAENKDDNSNTVQVESNKLQLLSAKKVVKNPYLRAKAPDLSKPFSNGPLPTNESNTKYDTIAPNIQGKISNQLYINDSGTKPTSKLSESNKLQLLPAKKIVQNPYLQSKAPDLSKPFTNEPLQSNESNTKYVTNPSSIQEKISKQLQINDSGTKPTSKLSESQKAMIEAKRKEALERRKRKMHLQQQFSIF